MEEPIGFYYAIMLLLLLNLSFLLLLLLPNSPNAIAKIDIAFYFLGLVAELNIVLVSEVFCGSFVMLFVRVLALLILRAIFYSGSLNGLGETATVLRPFINLVFPNCSYTD